MRKCCKGILSQNSGTDLYPSKDPGKGHGSLLVQSTCFADLEKAYDHASRSVLRESLQEYGVLVLLMRAIRSLYNQCKSCVRILSSKSQLALESVRAAPCLRSCLLYSWTGSQGAAKCQRVSSLEALG